MKRIIFLIALFIFIISCNSDDNKQQEENFSACFEINKSTLQVGEELQIINCSFGANSINFTFGDGNSSTEDAPVISYQESGEFKIRLVATSENGNTDVQEKNITVTSIENNYLYPPVLDGDFSFPINFSYVNETFSYIENSQNVLNVSTSKFNYVDVDLTTNNFSKKYLSDRDYNSGNAFFNILSNNENLVYTTRSLSDRIGLTQIKLDENWENPIVENRFSDVLYGSLENNNDLIFYGAWRTAVSSDPDYSLYKRPSIEIRNNLGQLINRKLYTAIEQGFIGDLVRNENGFVAFGGITDPTGFSTFENYRPMILFLDTNFEYLNHVEYENTSIQATNFNELNGTFHVEILPDSNLVLYSHNEFRIVNSTGNEIIKETLPAQPNTQSLVVLESNFIISSNNYLRKYNFNGTLIKSLKFNGSITPNMIVKDNEIYFASGYNTQFSNSNGNFSVIQTFFGAVDKDLNIINLN